RRRGKEFRSASLRREKRRQEDGPIHSVFDGGRGVCGEIGRLARDRRGLRTGRRLYRERNRRIRGDRAGTQDPARKGTQPYVSLFHSVLYRQLGERLCFYPL